MEITDTLTVSDRHGWRQWLTENHASASEIWLIMFRKEASQASIPYLDAVEEALCFGWIDGIAKKLDTERLAQRFTPRRPKSHWTELNKERVRRLIEAGKMTEAGYRMVPDLSPDRFQIAPDILEALQEDQEVWQHFEAFPAVYKRIRIGFIEEMRRKPDEFQKRLNNFLRKTRQNKMFGVLE